MGGKRRPPRGKTGKNPTDRGKRGTGHQAEGGVPGTAVGGGADPQRDEPVSPAPDPLGEENRKLFGSVAFRVRLDRIQSV